MISGVDHFPDSSQICDKFGSFLVPGCDIFGWVPILDVVVILGVSDTVLLKLGCQALYFSENLGEWLRILSLPRHFGDSAFLGPNC